MRMPIADSVLSVLSTVRCCSEHRFFDPSSRRLDEPAAAIAATPRPGRHGELGRLRLTATLMGQPRSTRPRRPVGHPAQASMLPEASATNEVGGRDLAAVGWCTRKRFVTPSDASVAIEDD